MEIYTPKTKIKLSPVIRNGREFVEVTFGNDNDIRLSLSKEENVLLVGAGLICLQRISCLPSSSTAM